MKSFKQFVEQNQILYHGSNTAAKRKTFNNKRKSANNMGILGDVETTRHGSFFSDNPNFSRVYGSNVTTHKVKTKNTYDMDKNDYRSEMEYKFDAFGKDRENWMTFKHGTKHPWQMFDGEVGKRFVKHLKSKGYDSAKFKEYIDDEDGNEHEGNTTVVFNRRKIFRAKT
jgi:hypothetical protein